MRWSHQAGATKWNALGNGMVIAVKIPDRIAKLLHLDGPQANRCVLELIVAQGYRSGVLPRDILSELLDLQPDETLRFLIEHGCARAILLDGYENVGDALNDFVAALEQRSRARKKRRR